MNSRGRRTQDPALERPLLSPSAPAEKHRRDARRAQKEREHGGR